MIPHSEDSREVDDIYTSPAEKYDSGIRLKWPRLLVQS
jgi:hypothetical protein